MSRGTCLPCVLRDDVCRGGGVRSPTADGSRYCAGIIARSLSGES